MVEFYPSVARMAAKYRGKLGEYDHTKVLNQCKIAFQKNTVDKDRAKREQAHLAPPKRRRIDEGFSKDDTDPEEELRGDYEGEETSLINLTGLDSTLAAMNDSE